VSRDPGSKQASRIVVGLFIIAIGVFALLDNLDLFDSHLVQPFWPLVFVALGAMRIARWPGDGARLLFSVGLIGVGAAMTLNNLGVIHFHVRDWWPMLLVLVGVSVVARGLRPGSAEGRCGRRRREERRDEHGSRIDASAILSGVTLKNDSSDFQGGSIDVVMGSVELDLRQAVIATEARLHVSVVMGGVEIKVPRDWSVSVVGIPTIGGIEDKTAPPVTPGPRLVIDGTVVMGGVEISN